MTRISNVDQVVALLRRRLRDSGGANLAKAGQASTAGAVVPAAVEAVAIVEGMDDPKLRRAFIQRVLADHFGESLINDANFQQLIDRVTSTLEGDPETSSALDRVVGELRAAAR